MWVSSSNWCSVVIINVGQVMSTVDEPSWDGWFVLTNAWPPPIHQDVEQLIRGSLAEQDPSNVQKSPFNYPTTSTPLTPTTSTPLILTTSTILTTTTSTPLIPPPPLLSPPPLSSPTPPPLPSPLFTFTVLMWEHQFSCNVYLKNFSSWEILQHCIW